MSASLVPARSGSMESPTGESIVDVIELNDVEFRVEQIERRCGAKLCFLTKR